MNEPLASAAGNAVEVRERRRFLDRREARRAAARSHGGARRRTAGAESALRPSVEAGRAAMRRALDSGAAAERFERMVAALGGPTDILSGVDRILPKAAADARRAAPARSGYVVAIDTRAVGLAVVELGGGRARASDDDRSRRRPDRTRRPRRRSFARRARWRSFTPATRRAPRARSPACSSAYRIGDAPPPRARPSIARHRRPHEPARRRHRLGPFGLDRRTASSCCRAATFVTPETLTDRAAVRYALTWKHEPGALRRPAQSRRDLLARRRRRSCARRSATCPKRRSCASSTPI